MAEPETIVEAAARLIAHSGEFTHRRMVITAGPTRERWDAIRYLSNESSGKMGYALAHEAGRRGAQVVLNQRTDLPALACRYRHGAGGISRGHAPGRHGLPGPDRRLDHGSGGGRLPAQKLTGR